MPDKLREINLEEGKPFVDQAIRRLTFELQQSRRSSYTVLKIIHGYGSSGRGGRIRTETRAYLGRLQAKGQLKGFIPGERFSIFDADTRAAFLVCDALRRDHDLDRHNNGVTFILL